jgi:hypothetical protein
LFFFADEGSCGNLKANVMMEYEDGTSENYKVYEVSTIIDTPEEYLLILKEPKGGEPIERVQKDIFHLIVE